MKGDLKMYKPIAYAALLTAAIGTAAHSGPQQKTSPPIRLSGGLICDTLDQVVQQIDSFPSREIVEGCGVLQGSLVGTVTPLGSYESKGKQYNLSRYDFLQRTPFGQIQFGYFGPPKVVESKGTGI